VNSYILVRLGYPPVIVQKRERSQYLRALDRADNGDVGPLGELFARAILDNLNRFILPAVAGPARLVPLEALATADLKVPAMRKAIERRTLRATRARDGTWRSSRQSVDEYRGKRWARPGRPRPTTAAADAAPPWLDPAGRPETPLPLSEAQATANKRSITFLDVGLLDIGIVGVALQTNAPAKARVSIYQTDSNTVDPISTNFVDTDGRPDRGPVVPLLNLKPGTRYRLVVEADGDHREVSLTMPAD
jgi:hypothetical protein